MSLSPDEERLLPRPHRAFLKSPPFRSEALRRAVADLPCARCGIEGYTQSAHVGGVADGKGMGIKVSDARIAALCADRPGVRGCHSIVGDGHNDANAIAYVAKTLIQLIESGALRA